MKRPLIIPDRCVACRPCAAEKVCQNHAFIRETPSDKPWIDFYACRGCMHCVVACEKRAILELLHPCDGHARPGW